MSVVISRDGTSIAYEKQGSGPPVILVDGALCSRRFGPMPKLAPLLAPHFTVLAYDRRGRGDSADTAPYAREREVEDLAALIDAAGGSASLVGLSSGAALALEAAAKGLPVRRLVAYEPPYLAGAEASVPPAHEARLRELIANGQRGDAVKYFMRDMVHVPAPAVVFMRAMFWIWKKLEAAASTLPYDAAVMGDFAVPRRLAAISAPLLAMNGSKTTPELKRAALLVAQTVPGAQHRTVEGLDHNINLKVLSPIVKEFLSV